MASHGREGWIYFIGVESTEYVKIGYTVQFEKRFRELQCGCPLRLVPLKRVRGTLRTEQTLLAAFVETRVHGEWFLLNEKLRVLIESLEDEAELGS